MKAVQELLGHSTMAMTMRYAHLSPEVRRDAVGLLDGVKASALESVAANGNMTATEVALNETGNDSIKLVASPCGVVTFVST